MEGEEDKKDHNAGEMEWTDEDKAAKTDSTEEFSKTADPITLDKLLEQAGVSSEERKTIKLELSFWYPKDLLHLTQAEIVTDQQYCSRTAQQAMYTIAAQLHDNSDSEV